MSDIKTPQQRSKNMAAIHSKNTKPEIYLRKKLFSLGYRYRVCSNKIPGHPDLFFKKYNAAIFVHGCFWHRHRGCQYAYTPKSNQEFWEKKFKINIERDKMVQNQLELDGIRYLIIWECVIRKMHKSNEFEENVISDILSFLQGSELNKIIE